MSDLFANILKVALTEAGYAIVPLEPTEAMISAGIDIWCNFPGSDEDQSKTHWKTMIASYHAQRKERPNSLEWLLIETAPRDGTFILLAGDSGYVGTPLRVSVGRQIPNYKIGRWLTHSGDAFTDDGEEPTLWMPLPRS